MDEIKIVCGDEIMICPKCSNETKFASTNVTSRLSPVKMFKCLVCGNHVHGDEE